MYAFLDADGVVLALATSDRTIQEVQVKLTGVVTERIEGAPEGLIPHFPTATSWEYHKKTSGDGTSIDDYELLEDISAAIVAKCDAIDTQSRALFALGFTHDGAVLSLSAQAQTNLLGLRAGSEFVSDWSTVKLSKLDNSLASYPVSSLANFDVLFPTAMGRVMTIGGGGITLKDAARACTTKAELDAIVDTRS